MRLLDLFSGIGGFSLGLERAGFQTVAFCEIDPFCRAVLAKNFPGVRIFDDIRTLTADQLRRDGIEIDAICGGFPCQDLSFAGKRAGLEGERSGLWGEYRRLIGELRPRFVIVENVPGLLSLGMGTVLGDLAALRYDAVWDCIPASAIGAPHRRDRVWIMAFNADASSERRGEARRDRSDEPAQRASRRSEDVADADNTGLEGRKCAEVSGRGVATRHVGEGCRREPERGLGRVADGVSDWVDSSAWLEEPQDVPRVIKGQENRANRLKGLGNSVVSQVVETIGRAALARSEP